MLRNVPYHNVMQLARDPLIRLVMESDGLCEDDMMAAFTAAMARSPAGCPAECASPPASRMRGQHDRAVRARPISQGHMRIVW